MDQIKTKEQYSPLVLNEEQKLLRQSARDFLKEKAPVSALRLLRDGNDPIGYSRPLWAEMAEMGWCALAIPESYDGLDFGYLGLGIVLEEMGRTLTASPMISTVLTAASLIQIGGSETQKARFLPQIAGGTMLIAPALQEGNRFNPGNVSLTATETEAGYVLSGKKIFVLDGHVADYLIVSAQTDAGMTLFLVDAKSAGINIRRSIMVDSRNAAEIQFDQLQLGAEDVLGEKNQGFELLEKGLDIANIGLAAEMLGTMREAFERTIKYLQERQQFGKAIGSFQGLQHRAAKMYCEIELCHSLVIKSLMAIDQGAALSLLASLTKAKVSETIQLVSNEAIQMFGGIGMTDDEEIGFFLKRARVAQHTFGDQHYHMDRFAQLKGY